MDLTDSCLPIVFSRALAQKSQTRPFTCVDSFIRSDASEKLLNENKIKIIKIFS